MCVCVLEGVEKVKLGGEVGVYDGCVGMGMCVAWGGISMCGPRGGGDITSLKGEQNLASRPRSISDVRERIT